MGYSGKMAAGAVPARTASSSTAVVVLDPIIPGSASTRSLAMERSIVFGQHHLEPILAPIS
jgi:hypothetical protein